jgi:hexosaminidase
MISKVIYNSECGQKFSMRKYFVFCLFLATILNVDSAGLNLVPWPAHVKELTGQYQLNGQTVIVAEDIFTNESAFLAGELQLSCAHRASDNRILLTARDSTGLGIEAYRLEVGRRGVTIVASSPAGAFYGCQTLRQLINTQSTKIPFVEIEDAPRYSWRGLMLDVSRHFFDTQTILQLLDRMADYKLNRFHLHLTDDSAWRLEIEKYPGLTRIGAIGNYSDTNAPARFYTRDKMQQIIGYAAQRHIVVVPEIDMPGHASAATRAYPQIDGGAHTYNPAQPETYNFLQNVLLEAMMLFPSPWIHFGGDEVDCSSWTQDSTVTNKLQTDSPKEMESEFEHRMAGFIIAHGHIPMGWDDTVAEGTDRNTVIYWWHHDKPQRLTQALEEGHPVILSPRTPFYFDYPQDKSYPLIGWRLVNTPESVYRGPTVPTNIPPDQLKQILGVEACVWTERIATVQYLEFMTLPRMAALAENAWTPDSQRSFAAFNERMGPILNQYHQAGVSYYNSADPMGSLNEARKFEAVGSSRLSFSGK